MDKLSTVEASLQSQTPIGEIKPIERNRNEIPFSREDIRKWVEPPVADACEHYWDVNVRTLASSANSKDVGYKAYIIIDYNSLSEENKKIARNVGETLENYDGRPAIEINVPVTEKTTSEEISNKMIEIANKFQEQKATWIPSYSIQQMREIYAIDPNNEDYGVDSFMGDSGFYYDADSKRFFLSEEHFRKANEEVN